MELEKYFDKAKGTGILATSDKRGRVDMAIYAKPHIVGPKKVAFIMRDKLSHRNVRSNPRAAYMFMESGAKRKGYRMYLKKVAEEESMDKIIPHRRRTKAVKTGDKLFMVTFRVEKVRALVGDKEYAL